MPRGKPCDHENLFVFVFLFARGSSQVAFAGSVQCGEELDPDSITTLAFANCKWAVEGRQVVPGKPSGLLVTKSGEVDDAYHTFEDNNDHTVTWMYLRVTTTPRA